MSCSVPAGVLVCAALMLGSSLRHVAPAAAVTVGEGSAVPGQRAGDDGLHGLTWAAREACPAPEDMGGPREYDASAP